MMLIKTIFIVFIYLTQNQTDPHAALFQQQRVPIRRRIIPQHQNAPAILTTLTEQKTTIVPSHHRATFKPQSSRNSLDSDSSSSSPLHEGSSNPNLIIGQPSIATALKEEIGPAVPTVPEKI